MILGHICTTKIPAKTAFFSPNISCFLSTSIYRSHTQWPVKTSTAPVRLLNGGADSAFCAPLASPLHRTLTQPQILPPILLPLLACHPSAQLSL